MRSCLVLGTGRSGTSMTMGVLAGAGYYTGDDYLHRRAANPHGFFEDREVNAINEAILRPLVPVRPKWLPRWARPGAMRPGLRWLARVPPRAEIPAPPGVDERIRRVLSNRPFALKDPRLCYTLERWRPHAGDAAFICVFRQPARTIDSVLRECRERPYIRAERLGPGEIEELWRFMYARVLDQYRREGDWLFLHYDQIVEGPGLDALERFLGAAVDRGFPDRALSRARPDRPLEPETDALYARLCDAAGYEPPSS